jgi:hypothetical protein
VVVSVVIALFIFFGAWAVSVDASSTGREFSLGFGATASTGDPAQTLDGDHTDASDSWWGNGLLKACPFH